MSIKKRPPGLEQTGQDIVSSVGVESPYNGHCTTSATEMQEVILGLLRPGRERAMSLRGLTNATGFDPRAIRRAIHRARREGIPILSDNERGYYLPGDLSEVRRFCASMFRRAREIEDTARAVRKAVGI